MKFVTEMINIEIQVSSKSKKNIKDYKVCNEREIFCKILFKNLKEPLYQSDEK